MPTTTVMLSDETAQPRRAYTKEMYALRQNIADRLRFERHRLMAIGLEHEQKSVNAHLIAETHFANLSTFLRAPVDYYVELEPITVLDAATAVVPKLTTALADVIDVLKHYSEVAAAIIVLEGELDHLDMLALFLAGELEPVDPAEVEV